MTRLLLALALLLAGCSEPPCLPATCEDPVALCGRADDGCGGTLECPESCAEGSVCSRNRCVCQAKGCAELGAECGELDDGCGGLALCGECSEGEFCGGAGPNKCGAEACVPKSCEEQGVVCGRVSDGCGKTIECDLCGEGRACRGSECVSCEGSSWEESVGPFIRTYCTHCHQHSRWTEATVRQKADAIATRVSNGSMPKDQRLSAQTKAIILDWMACGMP